MQVILLDEARFDSFANMHPNHNYYQSSNYGRFVSKHGYNSYYLGLANDSNEIKAATLMIVKNDKSNSKRKMGYAPRGFLIDWNDVELVKEFTEKLKDFLQKRGFTYLKLDPAIVYKEHSIDGKENNLGEEQSGFISKLQELGYIHLGFNNGAETNKSRWEASCVLNSNLVAIYNSLSKEARTKIKDSNLFGCKVYRGTSEDISLLYDLIKNPKPDLEYFLDYYHFFSTNKSFEIYFSKLEPSICINSTKAIYENELSKNNELNKQMQNFSNPNREFIINQKMKSDEDLAKYKKNMLDASKLFQEYPQGIIVAATAAIKYGNQVYFIANGIKEEFKDKFPEYIMYWHLFQQYAMQGFSIVNFNGISGNYQNDEKLKYKVELSNRIVEYVGEFDLVINKKGYYTGNKLNPIINWLNAPI